MNVRALVVLGPGTNRDRDVIEAIEAAGGSGKVVPVGALAATDFGDFGMLVVPGGFSYGDALGAGALLALDLERRFADRVKRFVESGRPVLGICNGFQALVKAGILPGGADGTEAAAMPGEYPERKVTLTRNARGDFECRWVRLAASPSRSAWTAGIEGFACPVAHGEGRIATRDGATLEALEREGHVALVYAAPDGPRAEGRWPDNPNGSAGDIAGLCNRAGNVLGLMPHPENAVRPRRRYGADRGNDASARRLFENGIALSRSL